MSNTLCFYTLHPSIPGVYRTLFLRVEVNWATSRESTICCLYVAGFTYTIQLNQPLTERAKTHVNKRVLELHGILIIV